MNNKIPLGLIGSCLIIGLLIGCGYFVITGSGNLVSENYQLTNFTSIEAHNGFDVHISKSNEYNIQIITDDNIQKYVEVELSGRTLHIQLQPGLAYGFVSLRANISLPNLSGMGLSGGSRGSITGFDSPEAFSLALSGGSELTGDIVAGNVDIDASGGSYVSLNGEGDNLYANGSGGSRLLLNSFAVDNANITLSGGGQCNINASGMLSVFLSGGSVLRYLGFPTFGQIELSGGSSIERG